MKRITCFLVSSLLITLPIFAQEIDFSALEQALKTADAHYEQAKVSKNQKDFDAAIDGYYGVLDKISIKVRREFYKQMDNILTSSEWQGELIEDMLSSEITILPQILYTNSVLTYNDIIRGYDLFLPPLLPLPEKNLKKYQEAWGGIEAVPLSAGAPENTLPEDALQTVYDRNAYYQILNSPLYQKEYITAKQGEIQVKISELSTAGDAKTLYQLGNAYLMKEFFRQLDLGLDACSQAQSQMPKVINTPTYTKLQIFKAQMSQIKMKDEIPSRSDYNLENLNILKEQTAACLAIAKVSLPEGITESMDVEGWEFHRLGEKYQKMISEERMNALAQYRQLVSPIYHFNLFEVGSELLSPFKQAVDQAPNNALLRNRLGNLYRISALKKLAAYLFSNNYYHLGYEWTNQPECKYMPINESASIDLKEVKDLLALALAQYKTAEQLDEKTGKKALGIYYLSQICLDPSLAKTAIDLLQQAGDDFALEYGYYLIDAAQSEQPYVKFPEELKNSFDQAVEAYKRIPGNSPQKMEAASLLGQDILIKVLAKTRRKIVDKDTYTSLAEQLNQAKQMNPDNVYAEMLQGYFVFRRGSTLSVQDALSVVFSTFAVAGKQMMAASEMMGEMKKLEGDPDAHEKFAAYAEEKGKAMEESFEQKYGLNNEIVVSKYVPEDFLEAVKIYDGVAAKQPDLAVTYYYLGRAYSMLGLYYSAKKDSAQAQQYKKLAQDNLKKFLVMSFKK